MHKINLDMKNAIANALVKSCDILLSLVVIYIYIYIDVYFTRLINHNMAACPVLWLCVYTKYTYLKALDLVVAMNVVGVYV